MPIFVRGGPSYIASAAASTTANILPTRPWVTGSLPFWQQPTTGHILAVSPTAIVPLPKVVMPITGSGVVPAGLTNLGGEYYQVVQNDLPDAYWRLDETASTFAIDSAGQNTGTYLGGVTLQQTGVLTDSLDFGATFNGTTGDVLISTSTLGSAYNNGPFSFEGWVRMGASGANFVIVTLTTLTGAAGEISIAMGPLANGKFTILDGTNRIVSSGSTLYNNSVNHHFVGTKIVAGNVWTLYVDGQDVTTADSTPNVATTSSVTANSRIGAQNNGGTPRFWFNGVIDEIAIYNYALTSEQVQNHYNVGLAYLNDRAQSVKQAVNRAATF